jgi:glutathione peroxidase-family protein
MFHKIDVNGDNAHDVFRFLRRHSSLYNNQTG